MSCVFCGDKPHYRDRHSGQHVCPEHARLDIVAAESHPNPRPLTIRPAVGADLAQIRTLTLYFWDETEVDCFGRQYDVLNCPAFLACAQEDIVGVATYAIEPAWDALVLVTLNVMPDHQGRGGGRSLLEAICHAAMQHGQMRVIVATSNDDLPALSLYQRNGFCITGIIPGQIAQHHGGELPGFSGIPIRDEFQLEYRLAT